MVFRYKEFPFYYSGKHLGNLVSHDSEWIPLSSINSNTQITTIHYHPRLFSQLIDIIRNERPLEIFFDTSDLRAGIKNKYMEPIGEES